MWMLQVTRILYIDGYLAFRYRLHAQTQSSLLYHIKRRSDFYLSFHFIWLSMMRKVSTMSSRLQDKSLRGGDRVTPRRQATFLIWSIVHNSPRLVNEHNILLPRIINICIVSESAFKVYIRGYWVLPQQKERPGSSLPDQRIFDLLDPSIIFEFTVVRLNHIKYIL